MAKAKISTGNQKTQGETIMKKVRQNVKQNSGNAAKHLYEASVKVRAIRNAGGCNTLNGHILEVMGADKTNLNPFNGLKESLVKSRTATTVDSIVTKGGKIVHSGRVEIIRQQHPALGLGQAEQIQLVIQLDAIGLFGIAHG